MSTRVGLWFEEGVHEEFQDHGHTLRLIDLKADVRFRTAQGWSASRVAIVDTGCQVTLVPEWVWMQVMFRDLGLPEDTIDVTNVAVTGRLTEVELRVVGDATISPPLTIRAFLCKGNDAPLLLGMEDFLTRVRLVTDYATGTAYLEFP